jgi:hypothetical protein
MKKFACSLVLALAASLVTSVAHAQFDTDADALPDKWELHYFGNLSETASGDPDWDALTSLQEYGLGANPNSIDSDGDMLNDDYEVMLGTDIAWGDSDGDGCGDGEEYGMHWTDPLDPTSHMWCGDPPPSWEDDSDEDGLSDQWEVLHFSWQWSTQDAADDFDGDGMDNGDEFAAGTSASRADTDWDEIDDGDEVTLGTSPTNWDTDGDGCSDGNEHIHYSSNPLSSASNNCP